MTTMNIPDFAGTSTTVEKPNSNGRASAANSRPVVLSNEDLATLTALLALFPTSIGTKTAANSLAVTLASDGPFVTSTGSPSDAAVANGAGGTLAGYLRAIKDSVTDTTTSSKVVSGYDEYETVAASQTDQVLGATGATGDRISHILIIPATLSPGAVSIKDGSGSAITIFTGGASSVTTLIPFTVPLGLKSLSGAWKITTGANVSAIGCGDFT